MGPVANGIANLFSQLGDLLTWWVVVAPWEAGIRVRLGKHIMLLGAGIYLRIPFVDKFYLQSVRLRVITIPTQTLITADGKPLTVGATIQFNIQDMLKLYQTMHEPDETLRNLAASSIAKCVQEKNANELTPMGLGICASADLDFSRFGLALGGISVTDFAFVKSYRLIMDGRHVYQNTPISTSYASK